MLLQNTEKDKAYSVGLDASISSFGVYCQPLGDHNEWYGFSVGTDVKHGSDTRRILDMISEITESIDNLPYKPAIATFEDYGPINRTSGKIAQRAEMVGILKWRFLTVLKIPVICVPPKALKEFATSNGNASKDMMLDRANQLGYYPDTHDEADAFFCARVGMRIFNNEKPGVSHSRVNPDC